MAGCNHSHDHPHDHGHGHGEEHSHGHAHHSHGGGHVHAPASFGKAFAIGITLNLLYVIGEAVYGVRSNSLALLSDAGHNLGDVVGLGAAWLAFHLAGRPPGGRYTYGLRGGSILAALGNAVLLLVVTGAIAWEAVRRFAEPPAVAGGTIAVVAALGIVVNGVTAWLFMAGSKGDLNIKGAYLHMAADAVVSAGTVVAGALILWTGWRWIDPVVSLIVSGVIVAGTWSLLRESLAMALDAVPPHVDRAKVEAFLRALPGVTEIHDLHIWSMSTTETALTVHLVRPDAPVDDALLAGAAHGLKDRFAIGHATFQVEAGNTGHVCALAPHEVV